ncbi:hypothetical protein [Clostridium sp. UBA1652]|uniref:hypothetical protein n=1 Tax=Clostridium sp. UBA1652 TaxID=1946348 RepID=UPI002579644B|nr:hypothetical protein [Clostridium sp. UBA1652]
MKPTKMFKDLLRNLNSNKYKIFFAIIIMFSVVIPSIKYLVDIAPKEMNLSIFDALCHVGGEYGFLGNRPLAIPIVPVFSFILISLLDSEKKIFFIVRGVSRKSIWNKQSFYIIIFSLVFSIILVFGGYLISGMLIGSFNNNWRSETSFPYSIIGATNEWETAYNMFFTYKMLIILSTSTFLGLCSIGFLIGVLKTFLKNIYMYLVLTIIIFSDGMLSKFSLIIKQMTLSLKNWIDPFSILINDAYLLLFILVCYILGKEIMERKDFI